MTSHSRSARRRFFAGRSAGVPLAAMLALVTVPTAAAATTVPAESAESSCPASAEGQSIEMWSPLTGPDGETMTTLAERFSSENGLGISVEHVAQPEYVQKLNAAAAAGQLPAMTVVRVINVGELAARHVLQPFTDETQAILGEDFGADFPENVWVRGEYGGERYSIPLDIHTLVMYYNKDMLAAAGVEEPGAEPLSREAFEAMLADLEASGVQPIAIGTGFQGATLFQTFIAQFGGAVSNDEGTEATYASEAGVQALEYVNELKQQYSPDIAGANDPEVAFFKQEQAAIVMHGPWHIADLSQLDYVGFAPMPQVGDEYAVWAGSHQLGLTTEDPAEQAAAACWIKWLSDNSVEWAAAGQVPARTTARESDMLAEVAAPISRIASVVDRAIILPQVPELEGALWNQFGPVVDAVLMGETDDVAAALEQAQAQSQQVIDENIERYAAE
ncbi:extracellular solute-binding protein [Desertimonas flava]|uniref:extracellular solute-binding protein n=1 Tax=Desertimonas flava TaxID=2064846 RepID=UPI0013C4B722|nr:extracellular solute-binding protein [Desertimonas flava]